MSSEFDTSLPSIRILQNHVKNKAAVAMRLNDGSTIAGTLSWFDPVFYCLTDGSGKQTLVNRRSVATIAVQ